jgi:hypothetical protein
MVEVESGGVSVIATVGASPGELVLVHPVIPILSAVRRSRRPLQDERISITSPAAVVGVAVPTAHALL